MNRVLIYDTNDNFVQELKQELENRFLWVFTCTQETPALEHVLKQFFHLCLWPVETAQDVEMIHKIKEQRPNVALLVVSSSQDPNLIVACMRAGASHFWVKENSTVGLLANIDETLARIIPENPEFEEVALAFPGFIGRHPKILEVFDLIMSVKDSDSTVLITGESGTGKEVVARAIHALSPRRRAPWVAINCGAIPASLLESELFGHVKGAFTGATQNRVGRFQLAQQGTLFLDEIGDLPLDLQAKILRAIQNRVYEPVGGVNSINLEARIVAATNCDLEKAVTEKKFREDLFYRLNVIPVYLPPLRSRKSDVPLLARYFLEKFAAINRKNITGVSPEAMQCLMQYHWPGNIRELENLMERVVVLKRTEGIIELRDFPIGYFKSVSLDRFVANVALPEDGIDFNQAVNEFENELILQALQRTAGNKNRAATLLNINRTTLVEKLKRKGLRIA